MPLDLTPSLAFILSQKLDGLTTRQLTVLLSCRNEAQTVRGLAAKLHRAKSVITRACDALSKRGFLARTTDQADRRSVNITLTPSGAAFAANFS